MAASQAKPGDVVDVRPLGTAIPTTKTCSLVKTEQIELIRMVFPAGKEIADHRAPGEIVVQCLEGRIAFTAMGKTAELAAGELLYLSAGEMHAVRAIENSTMLLTILLAPRRSNE